MTPPEPEQSAAASPQNELLSRMSHELRTPLNAILGFTQLLEMEDCSATQRECIEHIARAGQHLLSLINEVLELARLESGRLALNLEPIALHALPVQTLDHLRPLAVHAGIGLALEMDEAPAGYVMGDRERLKQIFSNLFAQLLRFVAPDSSISLRCQPGASGQTRFTLEAACQPIPEEAMARIFTPLVREANGPKGMMAGESLALSQAVARAMNGEVGVDCDAGARCRFWLELPPATAPTALTLRELEPALEEPEQTVKEPAANGKRHTLLCIEDEPLNRELLQRILQGHPEYHLVLAAEGHATRALARQHQPDLILLDLNLPDLSGEAVLAQLKADPDLADIPVVLVTADVLAHRLERLVEAGAAAHLGKPYRIADLLRVIETTMRRNKRAA